MEKANGSRYFYHADRQGSIIALSNATGHRVETETYAYGPFGETNGPSDLGNPFRYTAQFYDAETGLYHYRARAYHPTLGRFLQPDPTGFADGMNLYAYVRNNPMNFVDPLGLNGVGNPYLDISGDQYAAARGNSLTDVGPQGNQYSPYNGPIDTPSVLGSAVSDVTLTGYDNCQQCTGKSPGAADYGYGAYGYKMRPGGVATDPRYYPKGTRFEIPGVGNATAIDKGGAIKGPFRIDVWFPSHGQATVYGAPRLPITVFYPSGFVPPDVTPWRPGPGPW
jgi:RHS repeat-associated protein